MNWITGDKFKGIADFTYSPSKKMRDDYDNLPNTLYYDKLKAKNIIYTHTSYAPLLLENMSYFNEKFILISHSCDVSIDNGNIARPNGRGEVESRTPYRLPSNLIKWYTKNVNTVNPKIESIPIGLENDRWFPHIHKKEKMLEKKKQSFHYKNLLYINHNINTNTERALLYDMFEGKPWVTSERGANGKNFDSYLDNLYTHSFVLCPQGNGMDTHRTWECLYMGTIPIEKRNLNNRFYTDLPICFVDDWDEITEEFLEQEKSRIYCNWHIGMLDFKYWEDKIRNT